jgi:thiamine-phosphate pyrophosphorylase
LEGDWAIRDGSFWTLQRTAACLGRRGGPRKPLPALLYFTDPARTPDPEPTAARLAPGSAVVLRTFGAPEALARGRRLRAVTWRRRCVLLVGADDALAAAMRADGVHLPQRLAGRARRLKATRPGWIVTTAAHDLSSARRAARQGADAVVLSAAFSSASPSAGSPLGALRLAQLARRIGAPVYALGGVNDRTARLLLHARLVGLAGVEGVEAART